MLQGSLDNFTLDEVLGLLASTHKTGKLDLTSNRGSGAVRMHEGLLVDATTSVTGNGTDAEDVLFELLRFSEGTFSFAPSAHEEGLPRDVTEVLTAAEFRLADWRMIEAVVPSLRHVVAPNADLAADEITITRDEWGTLIVIAGGCSVATVCDNMGLGEVEGSRRIMQLVDRGLVCVAGPKSAPAARRVSPEGPGTTSASPSPSAGSPATPPASLAAPSGAAPSSPAPSAGAPSAAARAAGGSPARPPATPPGPRASAPSAASPGPSVPTVSSPRPKNLAPSSSASPPANALGELPPAAGSQSPSPSLAPTALAPSSDEAQAEALSGEATTSEAAVPGSPTGRDRRVVRAKPGMPPAPSIITSETVGGDEESARDKGDTGLLMRYLKNDS